MKFNLLIESWIAVRRTDHSREEIAPWMITAAHSTPISGLAYSRPDFNAAMVQFLIGLLQTFLMPKTEKEWRQFFSKPPSPEVLRDRFFAAEAAFNLLGDGPRFMQDQSLKDEPLDSLPVSNLLIDSPGENTLKENKAFFNKGSGNKRFTYAEAALALFCLQTNAPAGGQGHRTSLRGGGPLTTLIWSGETLWQNLWLNVLPESVFMRGFSPVNESLASRFPWMGKVRTSEAKSGQQTFPEDGHPAQYFWAMPRRIWLQDVPDSLESTVPQPGVSTYKTKNYGVQYAGAWRHPLSPYRVSDGEAFCLHPQPGGIGYRHWVGLIIPGQTGKDVIEPAQVIRHYLQEDWRKEVGSQYRLWAFGYDMDNMKARCWYEGMIPLLDIQETIRPDFEMKSEEMVKVADGIARNTQRAVQKAWFDESQEVRGDLGYVKALFWGRSEDGFYAHLKQLHDALAKGHVLTEVMAGWLKVLQVESMKVFDQYALSSPFEYENPKRVVLARKGLLFWNGDAKLKGMLGLPVESAGKEAKSKRKSKGVKDGAGA